MNAFFTNESDSQYGSRRKDCPGAVGIPLGGTRRPAAKREYRPALRVPRRHSRGKNLLSMLVTHHLPRETPPAPGLALRLQSMCEPRRRDRLPEEAMSEGARHGRPFASLRLRLSDQRRPTSSISGRAGACRRGRRGPTSGRLEEISDRPHAVSTLIGLMRSFAGMEGGGTLREPRRIWDRCVSRRLFRRLAGSGPEGACRAGWRRACPGS